MALSDELERVAGIAAAHAEDGEEVVGVLAAELPVGGRVYLCAFGGGDSVSWLALDDAGRAVTSRECVREAVSVIALCELAEESAAAGELDDLVARLVSIRLTDNPPGIDEAEEAVRRLQRAIGAPPRVATLGYVDAVGAATKRLEAALGESGSSAFADAMQAGAPAIQALSGDVEANYKGELT